MKVQKVRLKFIWIHILLWVEIDCS